jgi:hypothetical protein
MKTEETVETSTEELPVESNWLTDINEKIVGRNGEELHSETPEIVEEAKEEETKDEGKTDEKELVLTIKVNGKEEDFNLTDETRKSKFIEYAQKGRYNETIQESKKELEAQTALANEQFQKLSYAYLMNVSTGKIILEEPNRKDYLDDGGKYYNSFTDDDEAKKAFTDAEVKYDTTMKALREYQSSAQNAYQEYQKTISEFTKDHSDITDVKQFISDYVNPLIKPLISMGAEPLNKELLEAIYFYHYKDEVIKKAIEDDRKKLSKTDGKIIKESVKVEDKPKLEGWGSSDGKTKIKFR